MRRTPLPTLPTMALANGLFMWLVVVFLLAEIRDILNGKFR